MSRLPSLLLLVALLVVAHPVLGMRPPGDPLPRVQCAGYDAYILAEGLQGPDGLALDSAGRLFVAEESAGRVSRIDAGGTVVPVTSGLAAPEGLAVDDQDNLYVVEDVQNGRLLRIDPQGIPTLVAGGLDAPEGVLWLAGTLYITESNIQYTASPFDFVSRVSRVEANGTVTPLVESVLFYSYSGLDAGPDGQLYVANETAGTAPVEALFRVDPQTGARQPLTSDPVAPEGLRFAADGDWPLTVAEEDTGTNEGRLSRVAADGQTTIFCTGFLQIEDVVVAADGTYYVSEDGSGSIIELRPRPALERLYVALMIS